MRLYADVILPLPLANYFTYEIPSSMAGAVKVGCRVLVSFGRQKIYTAIVASTHSDRPTQYGPKELLEVLDEQPIVTSLQLRFWGWMSSYSLCTMGEIYKAALPSVLKLESETLVALNEGIDDTSSFSTTELSIVEALTDETTLSIDQLNKKIPTRGVIAAVNRLLDEQVLVLSTELRGGYKPKMEPFVRLTFEPTESERLKDLIDSLSRAPKQMELLLVYIELSRFLLRGGGMEVSRKSLLDRSGATSGVLASMIEKGIFEIYQREASEAQFQGHATQSASPLNEAQKQSFNQIVTSFREKNVVLLHGVTSSGKTEIYIHLINETLKNNRQVLYLVPEIALTTQLTQRLKRVFGSKLGVYHSKYSDRERAEVWSNLLQNRTYRIILGVRSSLFLPFKDLGLVVVDEEHESSYKQQDTAPRYHARNASVMLASMHGAKTLLGTATPSFESYANTQSGKYGLVELTSRYADMQLPEIEVVDTKELKRKRLMNSIFSPQLIERIERALANSEQIILFQNRRGFAPMMECKLCAWVPKCDNCDVSLTYHKGIHQLTCHYCGAAYPVPHECPACGGIAIPTRGFGTEQVEEEVKTRFPSARVARMDTDTTRTRKAYSQIISSFEQGKVDLLIGTQMVTKGLDFDRVSVVGILNADSLLNYPDFRAHERAFQMLSQVSGRSGRKHKRGVVLLQTSSPNHPVIKWVVANDFKAMFESLMAERSQFRYPPYYRLIYLYMKHRQEDVVTELAEVIADKLRLLFGSERVLGPDKPIIGRVQALFIKKIVLKVENNASIDHVRLLLHQMRSEMLPDKRFSSLLLYYDVDPV